MLVVSGSATQAVEAGQQANPDALTGEAAKSAPAPIAKPKTAQPDVRDGVIVLSNRQKVSGKLSLTQRKMLKVFDPKENRYRQFKLAQLSRIDVHVTGERLEREWRFKEEGSAVKIYTGRTSTRLDFELTLTLSDGRSVPCLASRGQPLYLQPAKGKRRLFLIPRFMDGEMGKKREDMIFVKQVVLGQPENARAAEPIKKAQPKSVNEEGTDDVSARTGH